MLQVARLSPRMLGESRDRCAAFLVSQLAPDGGFRDRAGRSDLYYTVFGLEGLIALGEAVPFSRVEGYLRSFGDGEGLDFVHLACLARCWAAMPKEAFRNAPRQALLRRLEAHRSADGGYHAAPGQAVGTTYHAFLALGAYQDLGGELPEPERLAASLDRLRAADGGYANQPGAPIGLTPATAAAVVLWRHLGREPDPALARWLLARAYPRGGFFASPDAPMPDLLSTATALHALAILGIDPDPIREPCLDFLDTLWSHHGGFYGHWQDDALDTEYTYYALLALGHLSL